MFQQNYILIRYSPCKHTRDFTVVATNLLFAIFYRMKGAKCLDDWPWIFKDFQKNGYATMFNEDEVDLGAFTYRLMGFCNPPMDHYLLPYWYAGISEITPWFKVGMGSLKGHCIGSQAIHNVSLEMLRSMYEAYPKTPKFGMTFFSDICHSRLNDLSLMENDFLRFLKLMKERNYLDDTILVTFGDHGIRFGSIRSTVIGKMEERLPFLSITLPHWFERTYPDLFQNLRENIDVLSSPLDVHATFRHILSYPSEPIDVGHGRSLFTKLGERVCKETGIPTHFCPCMEWKAVDEDHKHIKRSAQAILEYINGLIKAENLVGKCAILSLKDIKSAVKVTPNEEVQTFEKSADQDGRKASKGEKPRGKCFSIGKRSISAVLQGA